MGESLLQRLRRLRRSNRWIFGTMLGSALLSLMASFVLSVDAVALAADPKAALACNLNAVLNCGTVGASWQASVFGFPNAFLGLMAEPVVITVAVASLAGVRFPRWFMLSAQLVYTLGLAFAYWLFFEAFFVIGALCPWCLLVTVSTTLVFTSLTQVNITEGNLYLPERAGRVARTLIAHDLDVLLVLVWLVALAAMVVAKYGPLMI